MVEVGLVLPLTSTFSGFILNLRRGLILMTKLFNGYLRGIYPVPRLHPVNKYREHRVARAMVEAACATDTPVVAD